MQPLEAAKMVLSQDTISNILKVQEIRLRGWNILDRWALGWPVQLKNMEVDRGWLLLLNRLLDQQNKEQDSLDTYHQQNNHDTALADHEILELLEIAPNQYLN